MRPITIKPLFSLTIDVAGPPLLIGKVPQGYTRRIMNVTGGSFEGERLRGKVLPSGADWLIIRPDNGLVLDVRLVLETEAGELVYMTYTGRRTGSPEVLRRIAAGEVIEPGADYFRVAVSFETAAPSIAWLNDIIAVGTGYRVPAGPVYDIYEIE